MRNRRPPIALPPLHPAANLIAAGFWLVLLVFVYLAAPHYPAAPAQTTSEPDAVTPAKPVFFLFVGLASGVLGGLLQWRALDAAWNARTTAAPTTPTSTPAGDTLRSWRQTGWGTGYRVFFWLFLVVLLLLAFAFRGAPFLRYTALLVGYASYALARELTTLGKVWQLASAARQRETPAAAGAPENGASSID